MSAKRDYDDVHDTEQSEPESKRARQSRPQHSSSVDPNSGQKYVFASYHNATTIPVGEESDFEDDADAMAYLMSVRYVNGPRLLGYCASLYNPARGIAEIDLLCTYRSQASGIPHVIAAPKRQIGPQLPSDFAKPKESEDGEVEEDEDPVDRSIYDNGSGDTRGFYDDGAYIGRSDDWEKENNSSWSGEEDESGEASETAVQKAYFEAIYCQYQQMRALLGKTPPSDVAKRLPSSQATFAAPFRHGSTAMKVWPPLLRNTDPTPVQVALMSKDTVIRILRIMIGGKFLRRGYPLPERTSRWLWALLAKLPDRGELNYSEIGWIRDLGRRAVLLGRSLSEMAALRDELAEGGLGVNDAVDESSSDEEVVADEPTPHEDAMTPGTDTLETTNTPPRKATEETIEKAAEPAPEPLPKEDVAAWASEGEIEEQEDVAMDLGSESDEGEIQEDKDGKVSKELNSLEEAKRALLAQLAAPVSDDEDDAHDEHDAARERSRMNMRATLNMILTVAGEFYGQRDLLEFREPFVGM